MLKIQEVSRTVLDLYTVPNPKYYDLLKLGKNPHYHKKTKEIHFDGHLPPGAIYWSGVNGDNPDWRWRMKNVHYILEYPGATLKMRPYQEEPMKEACQAPAAIIEAPTGSGKTACAAMLIKESGLKTLILCHSIELTLQTAKEIEEFLGVTPALFYGKEKGMSDITVSTYMSAVKNFHEFAEYGFDLLIIDEADTFTTDNYMRFLCKFPCKRAFGFTATLTVEKYDSNMIREKGLMERLWGTVIKVETELQTEILEKIVFETYDKTYYDKYEIAIAPREWALFRKHLDEDEERKKLQIKHVCGLVDPGDFAIVLVDRVADVERYYDEISFLSPQDTYKLHGAITGKERKKTVAKFKESGGILIANIKIAGRGFNIPEANKAFLFCPMRGETPLRQAVGRILRWIPGKSSTLYDWEDSSLYAQVKKRVKVYKEFYPNAEIT